MEKDFNFKTPADHSPYSMPKGFIENMENVIWQRIASEECATQKANGMYTASVAGWKNSGRLFRMFTAAAAAITLVLVCNTTMRQHQTGSFAEVEKAFDNLNYDEQQFMIETQTNDVFVMATENVFAQE